MYEFLDSGFKRRAFKKALKDVKNEGYYIDLKNGTLLKPSVDSAKDVAELSTRTLANKYFAKEETFDVTGLAPNQEIQENEVEKEMSEYAMGGEQTYDVEPRKSFADSTFISGRDKEDEDMLSRRTLEEDKPLFGEIEEQEEEKPAIDEREEFRRKFIENIEKKIAERELLEKARAEQQIEEQEEEKPEETEEPVEETIEEEPAEEIAEEKSEPEVVEEPVKVEPAPVVETKTEPVKPKRKYVKRKKRKYDADIVGGFGF